MNKIYYKYCTSNMAIDLVRRPRLYFTPPEFFNDVYEMCPVVSKHISRREYLRYFCNDKYLRVIHKSLIESGSYSESYDHFFQKARHDKKTIQIVYNSIRNACSGLEKEFSAVMNKHVGVACLATINNSNLMWAHYADSHKGICIGFNFDYSNMILIDNRAVDYRNTKASLPAWVIELPDKERYEYYSKVAFSKSKEWSYEKEHRFLADLEQCQKEKKNDATYYYQELNKKDIDEVIFGIRCQHEKEIRDAINHQRMNLRISKCRQHGEAFVLSINSTT